MKDAAIHQLRVTVPLSELLPATSQKLNPRLPDLADGGPRAQLYLNRQSLAQEILLEGKEDARVAGACETGSG